MHTKFDPDGAINDDNATSSSPGHWRMKKRMYGPKSRYSRAVVVAGFVSLIVPGSAGRQALADSKSIYGEQTYSSMSLPPAKNSRKSNSKPLPASKAKAAPSGAANVLVKLRPAGYAYDPVTGNIAANEKQSYQSLVLSISTTPILVPVQRAPGKLGGDPKNEIESIRNLDQDLKRLDVVFKLVPYGGYRIENGRQFFRDASGNEVFKMPSGKLGVILGGTALYSTVDTNNQQRLHYKDPVTGNMMNIIESDLIPQYERLDDEQVTVLAMAPNQTKADTEATELGRAAGIVGAVGDILMGSVGDDLRGGLSPSSSLGPKLKTTAGGLEIIFSNLVPPRSVPTQFAFRQSPQSFGWYFRQNTRDEEAASILGLHTGMVLFEVEDREDKKVERIGVSYHGLAQWHKEIPNIGKIQAFDSETVIKLKAAPKRKEIIAKLKNLDEFPLLIPRKGENADKPESVGVIDILQLKNEPGGRTAMQQLKDLISCEPGDKKPLIAVGDYILKSSLEQFLGIKRAEKKEES